jgi:hypothetical protein
MSIRTTVSYIRSRLDERSTWLMIGAGIGTAAVLPWPWSLVSAIIAAIAALVPDGTVQS